MNTTKANDGKTYVLPKNPKWFSGFPPEPGWYPASYWQNISVFRFFDGEVWVGWLIPQETEQLALLIANIKSPKKEGIKWSYQWWLGQHGHEVKK